MPAEIEITCHCACGQHLEVEIDYIDGDIVLNVYPCKRCADKALKGLIYVQNTFTNGYITPEQLKELKDKDGK